MIRDTGVGGGGGRELVNLLRYWGGGKGEPSRDTADGAGRGSVIHV